MRLETIMMLWGVEVFIIVLFFIIIILGRMN